MRGSTRALVFALATVASTGCTGKDRSATGMTQGDPQRGREAIRRYGCGTCHTIPGLPEARSLVGPPLTKMGSRSFVAGYLPNTPENLVSWIRRPQSLRTPTAMPDLGVDESDGRDIAAYLYTLR